MEASTVLRAETSEKDGVISCSVAETNRIRAALGLRPLQAVKVKEVDTDQGDNVKANVKANVKEENGVISCSIEETNRIRAAQGLKPLKVSDSKLAKPPALTKKQIQAENETNALKQRIAHAQKQRILKEKLKGKTLGDETKRDGDSAASWLAKVGDKLSKRSKISVSSDLVEPPEQPRSYTSDDLVGLKVAHNLSELTTNGESMVLTLKDSELLDPVTGELTEITDELENSKLALQAKIKRKIEAENRIKRGGKQEGVDETKSQAVLGKYDKVIEESANLGDSRHSDGGTILGANGTLVGNDNRVLDAVIEERLKDNQAQEGVEDTVLFQMSDYLTQEEYDDELQQLQLDKPHKKSRSKKEKKAKKDKKRKKEKKEKNGKVRSPKTGTSSFDSDDDNTPLQLMAKKGRKRDRTAAAEDPFDQARIMNPLPVAERQNLGDDVVADLVKKLPSDEENIDSNEMELDDRLVLSQTSYFASSMQARNESSEQSVTEPRSGNSTEGKASLEANELKTNPESVPSSTPVSTVNTHGGLADTLSLLNTHGHLNKPKSSIVVGRALDGRPVGDSGEGGFVLEHRDAEGNLLTQKEAYRQLAYKFHGHQPGLKKQEKRRRELDLQRRIARGEDVKSLLKKQ
eukprot:CAMPEP_0184533434 /NCGR_PEP_ID=MMETSP0198_2-20121128/14752_1 /TAXON_ID=1112570 /ORGANISM="Thraustochytrium sp., Strain LLF1b" /LENGTH=632 /DNA_ID=CAMNT_0026926205 /DNA_START=518 /DNA_END=2416 /DNA_ORIENTATION=+